MSVPALDDPRTGLITGITSQLVPLFRSATTNDALAYKMAISAIGSYQPESRPDFVNAARTIAFSMAALALLGSAASPDMTMTEKMRVYGRATALNRSADQNERAMIQRRRYRHANPAPELPSWMDPRPDAPEPAKPDPAVDAAIDAAVAETLAALRSPAKLEPAAAKATPVKPSSAPNPARPQPSAIRPAVPGQNQTPPLNGTPSPFKNTLLRQTALRGLTGEASVPLPV